MAPGCQEGETDGKRASGLAEEKEEECDEDAVPTAKEVSQFMDKIQTYIMTEVHGSPEHVTKCIRDLVNLKIKILGSKSDQD